MKTSIYPIRDTEAFAHAVRLLRAGKVVAFPTDTVYGVGAMGFHVRAIERLYEVKERERDKAIPYLLADARALDQVARTIPDAARVLAAKFWPGALTLVVPALPRVPRILTAGGDTVAVRVPNHPGAQALIDSLGMPLAATSANVSGGPDPATAAQVFKQLEGRLPVILDGGATKGNVPSTVVDVTCDPPRVLRIGVITVQELEATLGVKLTIGN